MFLLYFIVLYISFKAILRLCSFFPGCSLCVMLVQDLSEACIAMSVEDFTKVVSAASLTLLRRDMSLNRRLYAWLLGANH